MPVIVGASWLAGVPLQAHHAISTLYDTSRRITIEAVVTELHFVNPHVRRIDRRSDGFWYEQVGASPRMHPQ
jgi:hypothetical protein